MLPEQKEKKTLQTLYDFQCVRFSRLSERYHLWIYSVTFAGVCYFLRAQFDSFSSLFFAITWKTRVTVFCLCRGEPYHVWP